MEEGTYFFDAILDRDEKVLFNGTRAQTLEFIKTMSEEDRLKHHACFGKSLMRVSISEYLSQSAQ